MNANGVVDCCVQRGIVLKAAQLAYFRADNSSLLISVVWVGLMAPRDRNHRGIITLNVLLKVNMGSRDQRTLFNPVAESQEIKHIMWSQCGGFTCRKHQLEVIVLELQRQYLCVCFKIEVLFLPTTETVSFASKASMAG